MTALRRPEPGEAGSREMGCISFTVRVAPIGSADDGAIDSRIRRKEKSKNVCKHDWNTRETGWRREIRFTFAYAQEGELAEGDDGAAGREVYVEIRVADCCVR